MPKMDDMIEENGDDAVDALATAESPATGLDVYRETPEFTSDDVFIPRLRLAQGLTKEVQDGTARPGQFLVSGFAPEEKVNVVPLLFGRQRELRDDEGGLTCFSRDGNIGEGDPGGDCNACPFNKWTEDDKGKRRPPACKFSYNYIFYSENHDTIASYRFKGMALNAGKMLNTIVAHHKLGNVVVELSGEQKSGKAGSYFIPKVAVVAEPTEGVLEIAQEKLQRGF